MKATSTAPAIAPRPAAFPETEIRAQLADWFQKLTDKHKNDPFAQPNTIREFVPDIDSLTVLESFIVLTKILDYKVPTKFIKKGGYDSIQALSDDLVPKLREYHGNRQD